MKKIYLVIKAKEATLKLDYDYFLKRRKLTTANLIRNNQVSSYEEFVSVLVRLKVAPPSEVVFNSALNEINMQNNNTKKVKNESTKQKKNTKQSTGRSASRKRKPVTTKRTRKTGNSSVSKT